jgi:uncharacterized membrane protein
VTEAEKEQAPVENGLEEKLAALEAERDEYLNDLKRVAAEFENYRKRAVGGGGGGGGGGGRRAWSRGPTSGW